MRSVLLFLAMFFFSLVRAQSNFQFQLFSPLKGTDYIFTLGYPSITTGYLDNDTHTDLILGTTYHNTYGGGYFFVFLYNSDRQIYYFVDTLRDEQNNIIQGYQPSLADLNFDGVPELFIKPIYPLYATTYLRYKMLAENKFECVDEVKDTTGNSLSINTPPTFFDNDQDTLADIYYFYNNVFYVAKNIGDTAFAPPTQVYIDNGNFSFNYPTRADFYNCFDTPRVVVSTQTSGIYKLTMLSSNEFETRNYLTYYLNIPFSGIFPEIIIDSVQGQSVLDLLFAQENNIIKHYQYNLSYDSGFVYRNTLIAENYFIHTLGAVQLCFYDLNNDGKKDIILTDKQGNVLISYDIGSESAYFSLPDTVVINGEILKLDGLTSPTVADFDANGKPELLLATTDGKIYHYEQISGSEFTEKQIINAADTTISIASADINNDGIIELLVSRKLDGNLIIYHINSNSLDSIGGINYIGYYPIISIADMNNDDYPDLVFIYQDNIYRLAIWTNDGNGNFTNPNQGFADIPLSYSLTGLGITDIDKDNKQDVIVGNTFGDLWVYLNKTPSSAGVLPVENHIINIYPNPAISEIYIEAEDQKITQVRIYSLNGSLVKAIAPLHNSTINIKDIRKGIYIIEVYTSKGRFRKKILKL